MKCSGHWEYDMMNAVYRNRFIKDLEKAKNTPLISEIKRLVELVLKNPFQTPPPYEKLSGRERTYSRRINRQHRLVYSLEENDTVLFVSCWSHFE